MRGLEDIRVDMGGKKSRKGPELRFVLIVAECRYCGLRSMCMGRISLWREAFCMCAAAIRPVGFMWGSMSRGGVYVWLSGRLNLPYEEPHIGYFSDYLCEETIRECEKVMENWNGNRRGRAA